MSLLSSTLLSVFVASILQTSSAQTSGLFTWKFTDTAGESITECGSLSIALEGKGTAPYYMIAYAVDGTPSTTSVGSDSGDLAWVVNQPAGTKLLLNVVDSTGSSGGTSASLYTVTSGQSKSCLVKPSSEFTLRSNATGGEISTCDPWGLTIKGGQSPYTVSLAAVGSPSVTNVTMSPGDNIYTYINRASPNGALLAAISDSTGKWASGTAYVKTKGSTDTTCKGAASSSGKTDAANADQTTNKPSTTTGSSSSTTSTLSSTTSSSDSTSFVSSDTSSTSTATTPTSSGTQSGSSSQTSTEDVTDTASGVSPTQTQNAGIPSRGHPFVSITAIAISMVLFF